MKTSILTALSIVILITALNTSGQIPMKGWDSHKICGIRYVDVISFRGSQYLYEDWNKGTAFFTDEDSITDINLKYNKLQDELIYYNMKNSSMVKIDKTSLSGFTIINNGRQRIFKKIYYEQMLGGKDHFFEVLYDGDFDLIALRETNLVRTSLYESNSGSKKNQEYVSIQKYFFYTKNRKLEEVGLNKKSILTLFDKNQQSIVNKLLRQNHIKIIDENTLIQAVKLIDTNNLAPAINKF